MLRLDDLIDDAKCYECVRQLRWPEGVRCVWRQSDKIKRRGMHQRQRERQRYHCKSCRSDFDDLTNTVFAHHHQPLRKWILSLYLMGLNLSNEQIAEELDLNKDDVHQMTAEAAQRRRRPETGNDTSRHCRVRRGLHRRRPQRPSGGREKKGRPGRRRRLKGERGRGTLEKEKPPI